MGQTRHPASIARRYAADDPLGLREAAAVARRGGLVVFPTDTLYGLGTNALLPQAIARLLAVKGRSATRGLPVLLDRAEAVDQLVGAWPPVARTLAAHFWPGALTLVVPSAQQVPELVTAGGTVAIRVPDHSLTRALIREAGCPLIGTSANRSGAPPATTAEAAAAALQMVVDVILDGGPSPVGWPSTVLDLSLAPTARIVRAGAIAPPLLAPLLAAHGWTLAAPTDAAATAQ